MDEIDWVMDEQIMNLRNNIAEEIPGINSMSMRDLIDLDLEGSDFISTHPHQDSLRFFGTMASYDIRKNIIYAEDVKIIRVADAAIFPGDGKLNILQDAQIETLRYADIIADTASRHHHIYNANVDIYTRHQYLANGEVDYIDALREATPIYLSSIAVDSLGRTSAFGQISDSLEFKLSPWYSFEGQVKLSAWQQFMEFDGSFSLEQDCFEIYADRALLDTLIDPNNIVIPVPDSLMSPEGDPVHAAIMFSPDAGDFYPSFFTKPRHSYHTPALSGNGLMMYDMNEESFVISETNSPDYLALHSDNCTLEGIGEIDLGLMLPFVQLDLYGKAAHYIIPDSSCFELTMGFNFFFDQNVLRRMTRSILETNFPGTETNDPVFQEFLKQRIPAGETEKIISDLTNFGTIRKLPQDINYTFFFNKLKFRWNRPTASLVSYGDIGLFSVGDEVVNRMVPGYVEIERKGGGYGVINVYFELEDGQWYFYSYRNYIMQAISSDEGFNNEILNLKEDRRIIYSKDEDTPYEFVISSRRKMVDFKRKMEEIHNIF